MVVDEVVDLVLGQAAGDLVEQQQASVAWPARAPARVACGRAAAASRPGRWRGRAGRCRSRASTAASFGSRAGPSRRTARRTSRRGGRSRRPSCPPNGRGIWYVRPIPSRARTWAGTSVTSRPSSEDPPAVGRQVAGDEVEHARLAGPVRADDAERLARSRRGTRASRRRRRGRRPCETSSSSSSGRPCGLASDGVAQPPGSGASLPAAGISGWSLLLTIDELVRERPVPLHPLPADERRLGDVRGGERRQAGAVPRDRARRSCRATVALMASRIAALSSTLAARLRASAATSKRAWAKPIGCVHCLPVSAV